MQNGFVESFNGSFRDECLNETLFSLLAQARAAITEWEEDYNKNRPHSSLGNITPSEFAMKMAMEKWATLKTQDSPESWREIGSQVMIPRHMSRGNTGTGTYGMLVATCRRLYPD